MGTQIARTRRPKLQPVPIQQGQARDNAHAFTGIVMFAREGQKTMRQQTSSGYMSALSVSQEATSLPTGRASVTRKTKFSSGEHGLNRDYLSVQYPHNQFQPVNIDTKISHSDFNNG